MTRSLELVRVVALGLSMVCCGSAASAQWINYPTPGMPRTPDGKPDLSAPAPRTLDGRPDLSGLWNIGGLGYATQLPEAAMLPAAEALYKRRLATYANDDPVVRCLPEGPRTSLAGLDPLRIVQSPNLLAILYETGSYRQIFTDGRPLPSDPNPTWMGYSVGHWEGDTLVVETAGYNDKTWLDFAGHPHSEALRVTERFRRKDYGHMSLEMTFDDPGSYVKPVSFTVPVDLMPDTELIENVCLENEKDAHRLVGLPEDDARVEKRVAPELLSLYAGKYEVGPLGVWTVSADGTDLTVHIGDGPGKQRLVPQSDTMFVYPHIGGHMTFIRNSKGEVTHFVLTVVEGDFEAPRK